MKCIHRYQPIKYMHLGEIFQITLRPTQACLTQNDAAISRNMYEGSLSWRRLLLSIPKDLFFLNLALKKFYWSLGCGCRSSNPRFHEQ